MPLAIVGTGIKSISHLTTEAKAHIEQADKVYYLVNEPILAKWIEKQNANALALDFLYDVHPNRNDNYRAIAEHVVDQLSEDQFVCLVMYGHPFVFCKISAYAIEAAEKKGYTPLVLPGISAEDCLFADLRVDPSSCGCLSYEATDLLFYRRTLNPFSHLVIWQIGAIGNLGNYRHYDNSKGIDALIDYLLTNYPKEHIVTCYQAAQYPHFKPVIQNTSLEKLSKLKITPISTLYVPPSQKAQCDPLALEKFNIKLSK